MIDSLSKKYVVAMQSILGKKRGDVSLERFLHLDFSTKFISIHDDIDMNQFKIFSTLHTRS